MKDRFPRFFVFMDFAVFFYGLIFVALASFESFTGMIPVSNEMLRRIFVFLFLAGVGYFFIRVFFSIFLPKGFPGSRAGRGKYDKT